MSKQILSYRQAGGNTPKLHRHFPPHIWGIAATVLVLALAIAGCSSPAASPTTTSSTTTIAVATTTPPKPANPDIILASTTSTGDSGLMDVLLPIFQQKTGYNVKPIYVGSGQAMTMGEKGEADVLLVHAPDSEVKFMEASHGVSRKLVMHNDFVIVGPASDPARIKDVKSALDAMKKIAAASVLFLSRSDNSGTNQLELKVWKAVGIDPKGKSWYQETGQGMGATLNVASEKGAYTITDRATYLATKKNLSLDILGQGDPILLNIYHVIEVNSNKSTKINAAGARAFADFMVSAETQQTIGKYGVDKYGQALFFPDAGKTEAELGSK
ncbi:MAG: substrate-binding domain-containing protein [Chloroflexi bacterium]|nr:substrate-binding domain-containing protein [Chloroflexota bacterium]